MRYFRDVYLRRINQEGATYQERLQNKRLRFFEDSLLKSAYLLEFEFDGDLHPGKFTRYRQGDSDTLHRLQTRKSLMLPTGTILDLSADEKPKKPWMVYRYEEIPASGYNAFIMLKMTHHITWKDQNGEERETWAYMYGQEDNMLKNEILGRSRMDPIYTENLKMSFLVMPLNPYIKKDDYFTIRAGTDLEEAYWVTGYDTLSQPGIMYVTVDPTRIRDTTPPPEAEEDDPDGYWLGGKE